MNGRITIGVVLLVGLAMWYMDYLAHAELTQAARLIIAGVTLTILAGLAFYLSAYVLILIEKVRVVRAKRRAAQRDANLFYLVADERQQVFIREDDTGAVWRPLHLNAGHYQNGKPVEPSGIEVSLYRLWHSRPALAPSADMPLMIEGQATPELLPILDSAQRVLIIGASGSGKTNVLQWVVSRRGVGVLVIDPHASPGKWTHSTGSGQAGAKVVGIGSNFAEIEATLDNLIELMVSRYKEIGQGLVREGEHPRLTIIIDEWMSIAYQCKNAHDVLVRLLTESRKAAFSVIIGSHSERVKSLGLDGKGDLKDGFLFIRLWLESTGERRGTFDYGRGERPCLLPGKFEPAQDAPIIEIEAIGEVKPTEQEQMVLGLHAAGESFNEICRQVYGSAGGKQIQLIKEILAKYQVPT